MNKADLIARKHEVIAQIASVRRQLERENLHPTQKNSRKRQQLERKLESLMAEEYRLRLQIDRSRW